MKYWLHRNKGGDNAINSARYLLEKGYISIGWSFLSKDANRDRILSGGLQAVKDIYGERKLGYNSHNCPNLSYFISDMKKGDIVVVSLDDYGIYEIVDDKPLTNESSEISELFELCGAYKEDGCDSFADQEGGIDLGFYRRVRCLLPKFFRSETESLHGTLGSQGTICRIRDNDAIAEINRMIRKEMEEYIALLKSNHNLILTGAPGTGKTYLAKEIAKAMNEDKEKRWNLVQFHPSYDYTDFVEGLRPVSNTTDGRTELGFQRQDGVFKNFCKKALGDPGHNYVLIIDEINRGEIAKIFGELFYSIDPGYRGVRGRILTQYQNLVSEDDVFSAKNGGFYVPDNVYIIGTMNDIDRGVENMDFAIRRRFAWKEVKAADRSGMLDDPNAWEGKGEMPVPGTIQEIKRRMNSLNACIVTIGLTEAHQIGASYFLNYGLYNDFDKLWDHHLDGLLREYLRGTPDIEAKMDKLKEAYPYPCKNESSDQ